MSWIFGLVALALVLVFLEVLLPGGVLGVIAFVCILWATWLAAGEFGWVGALLVFMGASVACLVVVVAAFKVFAKTSFGRRFFLKDVVTGRTRDSTSEVSPLIGKRGETQTRLNPTGIVRIEKIPYEAYSRDGYIEAGQSIEVVGKDNFKLIIKKI